MSTHNTFSYDSTPKDIMYRVEVHTDTNELNVTCIGMECVDSPFEGGYIANEAVPKWLQGRLSVLSICEYDPPTTWIEGVGKRIDANVYWVVGTFPTE